MPQLNKYFFLLILTYLFTLLGKNQQVLAQAKVSEILKKYTGTWQGELGIWKENNLKKRVIMQLQISPTSQPKVWNWIIRYIDKEQTQERKYELIIKDESKGYCQIDEKNSIFLDTQLADNKLISCFLVEKSLLTTTYTFTSKSIAFEVIVSQTSQAKNTGAGQENIPSVVDYGNTVYQKASLRKRK